MAWFGCSSAPSSGEGASGGSTSGGTGSGGASGSGMFTGGVSSGGASSGGVSTGGVANGGASSGGVSSGGIASGGKASGGALGSGGAVASGGKASGGTLGSGGQSTAGASSGNAGQGSGGKAGGSGGTETGTPGPRFIGRMDQKDAAGPRFAWSGSGVIARFEGTSVGVKLSGNQQYTVLLDGVVRPKLLSGSGTTPIAQGLAAGTHVVELYRRTEASLGEAQFLGFDFGTGKVLSPPAAKARRIELVGDSISCGYGNEGADMSCPFSADTENHYLSYGALAARSVDAELVTVAWSGKGVVCNYGDDATSCVDPFPTFYDRSLPARSDSSWDFSSWQPDAVIVNLGTNDLSTSQDPTQAAFESAYKSFIQHIRGKYANAFILCTNGPMLSGTDLTQARSYIGNVVKALNDAGDSKVKAFELTPQNSADGYGCDYHPSLATHQKAAMQVTAVLRSTLGW
jgi:lysophospholipase L1-like esterase